MRQRLDYLQNKLLHSKKHSSIKAVFFDRDGTINLEKGYITNPKDIVICPTANRAVQQLNKSGVLAIIITNQSAIGRDLMRRDTFEVVNKALWKELNRGNAYYDALYYCPHSPDLDTACECRKPQPGMLYQAAHDYNLNLSDCIMIGDKQSDIEAGHRCGCKTILVRTGWGNDTYNDLENQKIKPHFAASTLFEAINWASPFLEK